MQKQEQIRLRKPRDRQEAKRWRVCAHTDLLLPFRWDISRRECLGNLLGPPKNPDVAARYRTTYDGFLDDLLACAARVLALAGDADWVFLGRSPESLFDLLSGLLHGTIWRERLQLLRYSVGHTEMAHRCRTCPESLQTYRTYMDGLGLSPRRLIVRERPIAIIDLICSGETMHQFLRFLRDWTLMEKGDWPSVRRKLRVVGLINRYDDQPPRPRWVIQRKRIPGPGGWRPDEPWEDDLLEHGAFRQAAIPTRLWDFIGNWQAKTTSSYPPDAWGKAEASQPDFSIPHLEALKTARHLFESGCDRQTRHRFALLLAGQPIGMREPFYRQLIVDLRQNRRATRL